jgi:hypothetical protein
VAVAVVKAVLVALEALVLLHKQALVVDITITVPHPVLRLDLLLVLELAFLEKVGIPVYFAVEQYLLVAVLAVLVALAVRVRDILNLNLMARLVRLDHQVELTLALGVLAVLAVMVVFLAQVEMLEQQDQQALTATQEVEQQVVLGLL